MARMIIFFFLCFLKSLYDPLYCKLLALMNWYILMMENCTHVIY